ncbi:5143_t:CDS:2, partial [Dentiscutata heterogama]
KNPPDLESSSPNSELGYPVLGFLIVAPELRIATSGLYIVRVKSKLAPEYDLSYENFLHWIYLE